MRGRDCHFRHVPQVPVAEAQSYTPSTVPTATHIVDDLPPLPTLIPAVPLTPGRSRFQFTPLPPLPVFSLSTSARDFEAELPPLLTFPPVHTLRNLTPLPPLPVIVPMRQQATSPKVQRVGRRARRGDDDDDDDGPPPMEWLPGQTASDEEDGDDGEEDEDEDDMDEDEDDEDDEGDDDDEYSRRGYGSGGESEDSLTANFGGVEHGPPLGECSAREPRYAGSQALVLKNSREWNVQRLRPGVKSLRFVEGFLWFETRHIRDIANADASFARGLEALIVEHGWWQISDADVALLAAACPNLVHLVIDGCHQLTDAAMLSICNSCANIRFLSMSGRGGTRIKGPAFAHLAQHPEVAQHLGKIHFLDHSSSRKMERAMKSLTLARPGLAIVTGDTEDDDGAPFTVWRNGKQVLQFELY